MHVYAPALGPLHSLCSWSGYKPEDIISILMLIYLYYKTPQER